MKYFIAIKKLNFFFFLSFIYLYFGFWKIYFYGGENIFLNSIGMKVSLEKGMEIFNAFSKFRWIGFFLIPFIISIKILFTAFALTIGDFFSDYNVGFIACLNVSLKAEIAYLLSTFTSFIYIEFIWQIENLQDLSIIPFSLLHLLKNNIYPDWSKAILSTINLWEFIYIILISKFLGYYNQQSFKHNIAFTLSTYGVALLFWIVVLTYVAITLT